VNAFLKHLRRGAFAIGSGVFLGLIAAFGLVAPVFVQNPVVHATPADALPPCPAYQALLDQGLTVLYAKDGDVQRPVMTTFDYARLALYPDGKAKLDVVRKELLSVRPSRLGASARAAWAINVYNFAVIDGIAKHGFPGGKPVASVRDIDFTPDTQEHPLAEEFFNFPVAAIEGNGYTLNAIEWHFLFGDFDGTSVPLPASLDPRVHFALNRGMRGSPPLHPQAYRPETLDAQLEDVTRGALLGSKHLRWNGMTKDLAVSQIFEWYAADFGGPDSAFAFVTAHIPARTANEIRAAGITKIPGYIECEWTLNQTTQR
jgi:hypothetical protein